MLTKILQNAYPGNPWQLEVRQLTCEARSETWRSSKSEGVQFPVWDCAATCIESECSASEFAAVTIDEPIEYNFASWGFGKQSNTFMNI